MERQLTPPFELSCPVNRETCKHYPDCESLQKTKHHLRPRRLARIAIETEMSEEYQRKLKRVIQHPLNKLIVPRCIHDKLDEMTSDRLPEEQELDQTLEAWSRNDSTFIYEGA